MALNKIMSLTPSTLVPVFLICVLISIAVPLIPYVMIFHSSPISSDPQVWSAFGGYISGTVGPLINLLSLAVVIFIATVVYRFQQVDQRFYDREERRRQNIYDLHREFNTESMILTRIAALRLIGNKRAALEVFHTGMEEDPEGSSRVWTIVAFYERLWLSILADRIDNSLVAPLFGDAFYWWYINCFHSRLRTRGWERLKHMDQLWNWICSHASKMELEEWTERWGTLSEDTRKM
jgi:hypothetical protein